MKTIDERSDVNQRRWIQVLISLVVLVAVGCDAESPDPAVVDPSGVPFFRLVNSGAYAAQSNPLSEVAANRVFRDTEAWQEYFVEKECMFGTGESCSPPVIDFDRFAMILVQHEPEGFGCTSILPLITAVRIDGDRVFVSHRRALPEELGPCLAVQYPLDIVLVDRSVVDGREVEFLPPEELPSGCEDL